MDQIIEQTTRITPSDVNEVLRELASRFDPASVLREIGIDMGSLTEPLDDPDGGERDTDPTVWERTLPRILTHGYDSANEALNGLLMYYDLLLDRAGPRGSPAELLSPTGLRRLLLGILWLSQVEEPQVADDWSGVPPGSLLEEILDGA